MMKANFSTLWFNLSLSDNKKNHEGQLESLCSAVESQLKVKPTNKKIPITKLGTEIGITFVADKAVISDRALHEYSKPSEIPQKLLQLFPADEVYFFNTDFPHANGRFAYWKNGELQRSFSADPFEIFENIGIPFTLERPYWSGKYPLEFEIQLNNIVTELPFHPIALTEEIFLDQNGFYFTSSRSAKDQSITSLKFTTYTKK